MSKTEVIASVAGDLQSTEQAVDAALTHATTLVQSMIGARAALNISPVVGAEAQAKALEAIAALSTARLAMVACHEQLAKDHRRLGFGVFADGWGDKGQEKPPTTGEHRLRAV
jgi:lysozyme family protein